MNSTSNAPAAVAAALALIMPAVVQAAPPAADRLAPVITVTAKPAPSESLNHQASDFVDAIAVQPEGESLIRWAAPICPLAVGLNPEQNAAIAQRIAQVASAAGAPVASEACHPNFVVVATSQPDQLLAAWRRRDPGMFGDAWPSQVSGFLTGERPVRVWYNALRATADGEPIISDRTQNSGVPTLSSFTLSRLRYQTLLGLQSAIVVVDLKRADGLTIGQIADYAAMAGLCELKLDADVATAPSILRLFAAETANRPGGLTDWDRGFLAGLYQTDQTSRLHRSAIASKVTMAVTGQDPARP